MTWASPKPSAIPTATIATLANLNINAGCLLQMEWGARKRGSAARMTHPVEILDRAYAAAYLEVAPTVVAARKSGGGRRTAGSS